MHLSRVQIINFRNFAALDVELDANVVRIGKLNGIFAPVSAGAPPGAPTAWTLQRFWVPLPAPAGQRAGCGGQHEPWRMRRVLLGLPFCPHSPRRSMFLTTVHMCSILDAMSCHLPPLDAVRRVLAWRQLLPPMNPGIRAARCKPCHHFLYSGGAFARLYPVNPSLARNDAAKPKRRLRGRGRFALDMW